MSKKEIIHIATFGKSIGLKGEITIRAFTSDLKSFLSYSPLISEDSLTEWDLEIVRISKNKIVVKVKNINNKKGADLLQGKKIFTKRNNFPNTKENEYYIADLIKCSVFSKDNKLLGIVKDIENYGAGDLIKVKLKNGNEFLVPMNKNNIVSIDLFKMKIIISPMKGIMD